ncbi:unnamed protein product [Rangifer tarandus platyrhynchus]|uniref:Uncharacterized protein n=1 Tax=Rangifer tarandus platyrhynchus TaxID=3082113 RepID=A0ACB1MJX2_RANTA
MALGRGLNQYENTAEFCSERTRCHRVTSRGRTPSPACGGLCVALSSSHIFLMITGFVTGETASQKLRSSRMARAEILEDDTPKHT